MTDMTRPTFARSVVRWNRLGSCACVGMRETATGELHDLTDRDVAKFRAAFCQPDKGPPTVLDVVIERYLGEARELSERYWGRTT